jgi:hypothetical protein
MAGVGAQRHTRQVGAAGGVGRAEQPVQQDHRIEGCQLRKS